MPGIFFYAKVFRKNKKVTLVPVAADDREQFILDNQWSFKYGALQEFGQRDDHIDGDGEIISRKAIERCIDAPNNETYRIVVDGKKAGGGGAPSRDKGVGDLHAVF